MSFKEDWLLVDDIPTKFLTWGTWVEDLKDQDVVLMISGNPGITEFYMQFLSELHTRLKMPVWAVSHAGNLILVLSVYRVKLVDVLNSVFYLRGHQVMKFLLARKEWIRNDYTTSSNRSTTKRA